MVRYERFGLGQTWNDEYGSAADPVELGWLLGYSPYHRVGRGIRYPAMLFTVFDNDTRVDPVHARKICAALQHATSRRGRSARSCSAGSGTSATAPGRSAARSRCPRTRWPSSPPRPAWICDRPPACGLGLSR